MLKQIVIATALLGASACRDSSDSPGVDAGPGGSPNADAAAVATDAGSLPTGIASVSFTASYGECMGFCRQSLVISRDGALARFATNGIEPAIEEAISVDPSVRAQILAAGNQTLASAWDERYGCPDCADQGAYEIEIAANGVTRKTVLDPLQHPAFFDPLLSTLEPVRSAHHAPSSICAAAAQACTPGQVSLVLTMGTDGALTPTWYNDTKQTIYLAGCTTVTFYREGDDWTGVAVMCGWEGIARTVAPGNLFTDSTFSAKGKPGTYSATGNYSLGCTPGQPITKAACTSTTPVTSNKVPVSN